MSDDSDRSSHRSASRKSVISDDVWDEVIGEWINNNLRNSPMSNSIEAWNHCIAQLPELRKILEKKLN